MPADQKNRKVLTWLESRCREWDMRPESKGAGVVVTGVGVDFEGSEKSLEGFEYRCDVINALWAHAGCYLGTK